MRDLNTQELITVSGAGKTAAPNPIAVIKGILASKGISLAFDKDSHTLTITTPKGSKSIVLPTLPVHTLPTAPAEEAGE